MKVHPLGAASRKTCDLFGLLAGHEVNGLAPGEIAKALKVPPSWVSVNLPSLEAETGFVERIEATGRWRLGARFVRIATTVSNNLAAARSRLDELGQRYSTPL